MPRDGRPRRTGNLCLRVPTTQSLSNRSPAGAGLRWTSLLQEFVTDRDVGGKRELPARDKRAGKAAKIRMALGRDDVHTRKPANSGQFAMNRELSAGRAKRLSYGLAH
jgi:hypothetical protein